MPRMILAFAIAGLGLVSVSAEARQIDSPNAGQRSGAHFAGQIGGLRLVGPTEPGPEFECATPYTLGQPGELAAGTDLELFPGGLPADVVPSGKPVATTCGQLVIGAGQNIQVSGYDAVVQKVLRPEAWSYSFATGTRITEGAIGATPAVVVRPETPSGVGSAFVVASQPVARGFAVTIVEVFNAPLANALALAAATFGVDETAVETNPSLRGYLQSDLEGVGRTVAPLAVTVQFYHYAGVNYGSAYNSCGWHLGCVGNPNYERGLDWTSSMNPTYVYFNSWGLSSDTFATRRATAYVGTTRPPEYSNCPVTSVKLRDAKTSQDRMTMFYVHSVPVQGLTSFGVYAKSLTYNGYWNSIRVGTYDGSGCTTTGAHSHTWFQTHDGTYNTLARDNYAACPTETGFFFHCFNTARSLPHDLSDWAYVSEWQQPY